ncbi:hypothetical protein RclHR1_06770002 [Rhizophagus clarus]|uniref:Kinase-like domain-containing protein n=1 Tax=Rhizophagus clarus TaxID=94130 RepID=A0A2Z6SJT4_9GLOM|nr:hypothetical protein RclHR1_06770002 [Rhizophagus clarus]GES88067.1 kinase-like domain-containing protein [Rhizophagus clarus]
MPHKQLNSDDNNSNKLQSFNKVNIKEIEPTIENITEYIFKDFNNVINELINLILKRLNEGKNEEIIKKNVIDFFNIHMIILKEIYDWFLNNQNNSNSIFFLGYFNYHGIETNINKKKAMQLYQKAADLGNSMARLYLTNIYIYENCISNCDKAFKLSEKLAEEGIPNAINNLGYCYHWGFGTSTNYQKAFELYQKAADLGNMYGLYNIGWCYSIGAGFEFNEQKALESFQKAANSGYDAAQCKLAFMYENGDVIEKDMDKAIYWYKKSAEQGYECSQHKLKKISKE